MFMTYRRADMDLRSLYAGSPRSLSHDARMKTDQRQRPYAIPDNSYPESMTCSVSTLSSHSASPAPSLDGSTSPVFDTADYSDPSFVPTDIMSNAEAAFGIQSQHTAEYPSENKPSQLQITADRPQSFGLPLRTRDEGNGPDTKKTLKRSTTHPVRASSVSARQANRAFDLMAPPPGRRNSGLAKTDPLRDSYPHDTVDADPSAALTSRIASSILREGYGFRAAKTTVPLKVHDAVQRCLQEVSTTVQKEHPPWTLPQYRKRAPKPYAADSETQFKASEHLSDSEVPTSHARYGISSGEDEDPFAYDNSKETYQKFSGFGNGGYRMGGKVHSASTPYSCPFRKRNPVMFNVRDHEHCAKRPFFGIQELKHHIRTYHRACIPPHSCPRCKAGFQNSSDLSEHLMVPVEEMCEPNATASDHVVEEGITEEMDRILADPTPRRSIRSWEQIWKLLFPQDASALDSEYLPVIEMVEMEQKLDDSQAELRADLSESLQKLIPEHSEDVCFFLAGQFQLVFDQHRAKVNRKCRISACGESIPTGTSEKTKSDSSRMSRFSVRNFDRAALRASAIHGRSISQLSSPRAHGRRPSQAQTQAQQIPPRTTVSPASTSSSVYSQDPAPTPSNRSRTTTRSSIFSMSGMQVESPRLPFKDWVHGVKFNATGSDEKNYQRDSGLALEQCEGCEMEPCQCEAYNGYADHLSAFMTPAPDSQQPPFEVAPCSTVAQAGENEEADWAAQYSALSPTPGVPESGPSCR